MSLFQIFKWPFAMGLLTCTGLVAGLMSEGWEDVLAAIGLGAPVLVVAWAVLGPRR